MWDARTDEKMRVNAVGCTDAFSDPARVACPIAYGIVYIAIRGCWIGAWCWVCRGRLLVVDGNRMITRAMMMWLAVHSARYVRRIWRRD